MKLSKLLLLLIVTSLLSACANITEISQESDEIRAKKSEIDEKFSAFKVSELNYLDLKNNDMYPSQYWSLKIKKVHFKPVSIDEVLTDLSKRLNVSYLNKGVHVDQKRSINFEGSVGKYIDYLADVYDVFIDIDKHKIVKNNVKTKVYKLYNSRYLKNESTYAFGSASVESEGGSNGFTGSIEIGGSVDLWEEIEAYLETFIELTESSSEDGAMFSYAVFKEFSQITVTGSKNHLDQIDLFVNNYNTLASTEIKITYKIITIEQDSLSALGADIQGLDSSFQIDGSASKGFGGQDTLSMLLGSAVGGSTDKIGGSLTAQLLKSGARIVTEGVAISLNGKPIPVNSVSEVGYVSSTTREPGSEFTQAAQTIETDTLETGLSFMIVPDILSDGRINITMGYSRKKLNKLDSFGASSDSVQLPDMSRSENINNLIVEEGQETVVAIFSEESTARNDFTGLVGKSMSDTDKNTVTALIVKVDTKK